MIYRKKLVLGTLALGTALATIPLIAQQGPASGAGGVV